MATTIELTIKLNKGTALPDLEKINAEISKMSGKPIAINFTTTGGDVVIKQAKQATTALLEAEAATQRRIASEKNLQSAQERRATAEINAASKTEQALKRADLQAQRHADRMEEIAARTNSATTATNAFTIALGNLAARAVHLALSKITQGIREAINEMKEVDTQLTNISKVSGITGKALADMGERAYETASKYGVAADEYLAAVYTFQKAGLNDSAEAMGELAVKTMLVGDTTADVATQFLISANAAWKFGGNMERLGQIVDEADYINNNYATDLGKLSSGLPRVASIAAQAGMSAEETLAALGTITAVTQESGTKAATALRALILNIEGQVGTFVDDTGEEFEVTAESVKSMEGLMNKYAKAEIEAAKASGELINPMTAIKAIFEGMANSDLNDQELFQLLSGMGGKLRTNQLTALVQNYELFDEMLERIAGSAGTADSEISLMMESWERKAQVLKNTWTEFVADFVDSSTFKNAITGLTEVVSTLDDLLFKTGTGRTQSKYASLMEEYDALLAKGEALTNQEKIRLQWIQKQTDALLEQAAAQANLEARNSGKKQVGTNPDGTPLYYEDAMYESLTASWQNAGAAFSEGRIGSDEYLERMRKAVEANRDYYDSLVQWRDAGADLSESQKNFITDFEDLEIAAKATSVDLRDAGEGYQYIVNQQGEIIARIRAFDESTVAATTATEDLVDLWSALPHPIKDAVEENNQMSDTLDEEALHTHTVFDDIVDGVDDSIAQIGQMLTGVGDVSTEAEGISFEAAITGAEALTRALEAASAAAAGISAGPVGFGFATGTANAPGGPTLVNELGPELISENGRAYIANGGRPGIVNLSRGAIVLPASVTKDALRGGSKGNSIHAAYLGQPGGSTTGSLAAQAQAARNAAIAAAIAYNQAQLAKDAERERQLKGDGDALGKDVDRNAAKRGKTGGGGGGSGSGSGSGGGGGGLSKKEAAKLAESLKDLLSNLDKQAKLANNQGDYVREVQIYEQAQEAIKKMVDDYRRAGYADDSDEILDLLNKNYDYANKQLSLYQSKWDELIKALEADTDAQEMANKLAEKQQAVDDAREALANAQRQRTVRMYNSATGQWEWVSDNKTVSKAQESLTKAEDAYAEELKSQAIKELENAKDAGLALEDIVLGPALSAVALMAEETDEFQNFARALNAVYGVGSFLQSTEGSSTVIPTTDSHDVNYTFGNITLTEEQASSMSVAELAKKLSVLQIS